MLGSWLIIVEFVSSSMTEKHTWEGEKFCLFYSWFHEKHQTVYLSRKYFKMLSWDFNSSCLMINIQTSLTRILGRNDFLTGFEINYFPKGLLKITLLEFWLTWLLNSLFDSSLGCGGKVSRLLPFNQTCFNKCGSRFDSLLEEAWLTIPVFLEMRSFLRQRLSLSS